MIIRSLVVATLLTLFAASGAAEGLEPLVITASRFLQPIRGIPASVTVISSADVKAAPAHALDDLLRTVPGVNMLVGTSNNQNPGRQTVSLMGLGMGKNGISRALVLLDGVPMTNGFNGMVNWSAVPLNLIDRVEVVRGGNSSLYGPNAMAGVINIITRSPKARAVEFDGSYGSHRTRRYNAYISEPFMNTVGLSVNYTYFETAGYPWVPVSLRGPIDKTADARNWNLQLKLASLQQESSEASWFLRGNLFQDWRNHGQPYRYDSRDEMDLAGGFHRPLNLGELNGNIFLAKRVLYSMNSTTNKARTTDVPAIANVMPQVDSGGSLQWTRPFEALLSSVTIGVDFRHVAARNNQDDYNAAGAYMTSLSSGGQQTTVGVFCALNLYPLPNLLVNPSARVDYWQNHNAFETGYGGATSPLPAKTFSFFSPRLGLHYQATDALAVRGSVYRAFSTPSLHNLYRGSRPPGGTILPNSGLGPEILRIGADVGWDLMLPPFGAHVTAFWNELSNAIAEVSVASNIQQSQNVGGLLSRGFMVETPMNLTRALFVAPSYTYTDSRVTSFSPNPSIEGNRVPDIPEHQLAFTVGYDQPRIINARLRGRYLSRRYGNDTNTQHLDAHFVLDLSANRKITDNLEAYLDCENLLDRSYSAFQFGNYGALGQPLYIGLGLRLRY